MIGNENQSQNTPTAIVGSGQPAPYNKPKRESFLSTLLTVGMLLIAIPVALLLTAFVFQSYQVDGPSMETTLSNNDRLLVWKVPKTWSRVTGNAYIPKRGDVVIFIEREDPLSNVGKQLIKRVIALPGERVVVKDGVVTVFNDEHPNGFQPDKTLPYGNIIPETLGNDEWTIRKDQVFVLGDNRGNSLDSRAFGPVSSKDIVGKLIVRVWPANKIKVF